MHASAHRNRQIEFVSPLIDQQSSIRMVSFALGGFQGFTCDFVLGCLLEISSRFPKNDVLVRYPAVMPAVFPSQYFVLLSMAPLGQRSFHEDRSYKAFLFHIIGNFIDGGGWLSDKFGSIYLPKIVGTESHKDTRIGFAVDIDLQTLFWQRIFWTNVFPIEYFWTSLARALKRILRTPTQQSDSIKSM